MIQDDIGDWHVKTFENCETADIIRKLIEESMEFTNTPSAEEAADICIVLYAWAHREGIDLDESIRQKFSIVKDRPMERTLRDYKK